jgi:hypothetical protein
MTMMAKSWVNVGLSVAIGVLGIVVTPTTASAQAKVTGGVDFPTLYYFRGFRQETDPALTVQPFVDVGAPLMSGDGTLKSASVNVGSWNSIHTGSNKDDFDGAFYESDFYATLGLGFSQFALATTYTAYAYPAPDFDTIHEIMFKGTSTHKWAPYGLIAFEFAEDNPGTYLELGVGPTFPLTDADGAPTLTVPIRAAFDLKDYYGGDDKFGYFGVGGTVTIPRGKWSIKALVDVLLLGDTLEAVNFDDDGDTSQVGFVGLIGIGFSWP